MSLKKEEVEKDIFIHFSKKELEDCKIEVCDIDEIVGCIERFEEEKICCYLSKDSFYILYFVYLKDTKEVLDIDVVFDKKENILNKLNKTVNKILNTNFIKTDVCVEIIIFDDIKLSEKILQVLDKLRDKILLNKDITAIKKIENFFTNLSKKLFKRSVLVSFFIITFITYTTFINFYLNHIGIPLDFINAHNLDIFVKSIVFITFSLIYSILTLILGTTVMFVLVILFAIYFLIYLIKEILININLHIEIFKLHKSIFSFNKYFPLKDLVSTVKFIFLLLLAYIIFMTTIFIYAEPIVFFSKYTGLTLPGIHYLDKNFNANVAKKEILKNIYTSSPDLRFIKIDNSIDALQLGTKNDLIYYYKIKDINKILEDSLKENIKECYCNNLQKLEKQNNGLKSENYKLFYLLFYLPTECGIYPYEQTLKEKLNTKVVLNTKIENLEGNEYVRYIKNFCEKEDKENERKK